MRHLLFFSFLSVFVAAVVAQDALKPTVVQGEVVSISTSDMVVKTKDAELRVILSGTTAYKRVSPEKPSITTAAAAAFSDIDVGDKVVVSGVFGEDKSRLPARTVYLMSKADIADKQRKDVERWTVRGISGKVSSINTATNQIAVEVRGLVGSSTVTITPKQSIVFKRYAPNSVKYAEAVASSIAEIKPGDMLRATGDRSADGLSFAADEIITGAFQTIAGTVKSVDVEKNEVVITNLQTNKDVTIALGTASVMKKFPEEMANRMAMMQGGGAPGAGGAPPNGGQRPAPAGGQPGAGQPGAGGPMRGMGGAPRGGIDEMLERFPNITAADLKPGDMIAVSSTRNGVNDHISAIKLLAGVEPFIRAAQASGEFQRNRGGAGQGSFTIPGLDGFDFP